MEQQAQALTYFETFANDWQSKATDQSYNAIDNRHNAVMSVINEMRNINTFLDIGCGTGQLVIQVARKQIEAHGIDFANEMINNCEKNKIKSCVEAKFECISFFDATLKKNYYDVISAQGFIEYITLDQLEHFFEMGWAALKEGGSLVVGSRNRLFNLHSLNEFTNIEIEIGTILNLIREASILHMASTHADAFSRLMSLERIDPQPDRHPLTGIKEDTRYQFSPADLIYRARRYGYQPKSIFPVHFHALPVNSKNVSQLTPLHNHLAQMMSEERIRDHRLVPYSSSFVLELTKCKKGFV